MAFYRPDPAMGIELEKLLDRFAKDGRPGLHDRIAINWIRYENKNPLPCSGKGNGWLEKRMIYPASVVKLFYAVATEAWLQKDWLVECTELRRALKEMITQSSNDATALIIDYLTGTTSGPSLSGEKWLAWQKQRQLINKWLQTLQWPELLRVNCCQKTWNEGPYGRERDFYGESNLNRNALSTTATARMLEAVMTNSVVSPIACKRLKKLLSRSIDVVERKKDPENQVDGFIGAGLPKGTQLWSKAGLMSEARHDAAWICMPQQPPMLLVVFTQGKQLANDPFLFPALTSELIKLHKEID